MRVPCSRASTGDERIGDEFGSTGTSSGTGVGGIAGVIGRIVSQVLSTALELLARNLQFAHPSRPHLYNELTISSPASHSTRPYPSHLPPLRYLAIAQSPFLFTLASFLSYHLSLSPLPPHTDAKKR